MIRQATIEDVPEIVRMSEEFWKHAPFSGVPFDSESAESMAECCISEGMMWVSDIDGVHGFICGGIGPVLGNFEYMNCTEVAWWVDPEYRRTGVGLELLVAMEEEAKQRGCKYMSMLFMESSMPEEVQKIYRNRGYQKKEATFTRVL